MTLRVPIAPKVLKWAVERTGLSVEELAKRSQTKAVQQWLEASAQPTLNQAEELARLAGIPFGYLLLEEPTDDTLEIADFRTPESKPLRSVSPELEELLIQCKSRLSFYTEYSVSQAIAAPSFVGKFSLNQSAGQAARSVSEMIDWWPGKKEVNRERVLTLADAIEAAGVLVMRSSVVGNNTNRKLDVSEFRGFTLIDHQFALIFVNGADAKVGQLFSLGHELGHVLLGQPGLSGERNIHRDVERWCNSFAAGLLVSTPDLRAQFENGRDLGETAKWAYDRYGVSKDVVAWALVDTGAINRSTAQNFLLAPNDFQPPIPESSGGSFWNNLRVRLGGRFLDTVAGAVADGDISLREASHQLGIDKAETLDTLVARFQGVA